MDSELAALASTAATALVKALTTDGWEAVKSGTGALWRRVHAEHAETIETEIVSTRTEILAAREAADTETETSLIEEWQRRLVRLLREDPELADALTRLVEDQWYPLLPSSKHGRPSSVQMEAEASGHGRTYQAGRDMRIVER
jgi:hypothetical protein